MAKGAHHPEPDRPEADRTETRKSDDYGLAAPAWEMRDCFPHPHHLVSLFSLWSPT